MDDGRARELLLETAALLVQEDGASALSFEALAEAADLPRDEVARLFPDLKALVVAMVERMFATFLARVETELGDDETPGAWLRAYLRASFPEEGDNFTAIAGALLSTVPFDPRSIECVRDAQADIYSAIETSGIDPVTGSIIRLAVDGLWMGQMFGIEPIAPDLRQAVLKRLNAMAGANKA